MLNNLLKHKVFVKVQEEIRNIESSGGNTGTSEVTLRKLYGKVNGIATTSCVAMPVCTSGMPPIML